MRWVVHASTDLQAHHALASYRGAAEQSHAHAWRITIRAGTDRLGPEGYAIDFEDLRGLLERAVAPLRDSDLNEHPEIGAASPTAEHLAEVVAGWLQPQLQPLGVTLLSVSIWEGPENRVDLNL